MRRLTLTEMLRPMADSKIVADIKVWLRETGFPFEMKVAAAFEKAGFQVQQGMYYTDPDTEVPREIDVVATLVGDRTTNRTGRFDVCIECKNIAAPWVAFGRPQVQSDAWKLAVHFSDPAAEAVSLSSPRRPGDLDFFAVRQQGGKAANDSAKGADRDQPYQAITQANGASSARVNDWTLPDSGEVADFRASVPVVAITGNQLFTAHLAGELVVNETPRVCITWTRAPKKRAFTAIHIVVEDELAAFATEMRRQGESFLYAVKTRQAKPG